MTLQEAIKSGKRFKRNNGQSNWKKAHGDQIRLDFSSVTYNIRVDDVLADDWIVEEQKIELTWEQILWVLRSHALHGTDYRILRQHLGFTGDV